MIRVALWLICLSVLITFAVMAPVKRTVNCDVSSFHPDLTEEMKQACRDDKARRKL